MLCNNCSRGNKKYEDRTNSILFKISKNNIYSKCYIEFLIFYLYTIYVII